MTQTVTASELKRKPRLTESQIQQTCCEFLALDGWRRIRTDMKQLRGMGVQEPGMADDLFIRHKAVMRIGRINETLPRQYAEVIWIEWKRAKGGDGKRALFTKAEKAKIHQQAWHAAERARGALTWIAGEDFPASIDGFMDHYRKSGLRRNTAL